MSIQSRVVLKSYFETGDTPTEAQFIDLIDTFFSLSENDSDDIPEGSGNLFVSSTEKAKLSDLNVVESNTLDTGALVAGVEKTVLHSLDLIPDSVMLIPRNDADTNNVGVAGLRAIDANNIGVTSNVNLTNLKVKLIGIKN